jgi:hypothetical protein
MDDRFKTSFDRIWRLVALFILCALVYYFSFQNGRQTAKAKNERLTAENESLRLQLSLQSKDLEDLRFALKSLSESSEARAKAPDSETAQSPKTPENSPEKDSSPLGNAGAQAASDAPPMGRGPMGGENPYGDSEKPKADPSLEEGGKEETQNSGSHAGEEMTREKPPEDSLANGGSAGPKAPSAPPLPLSASPELSRIQLRNEENKLILNNMVLLSVLEIDGIDKTVQVRVHQLDTEARETRTMSIGDSFTLRRGETGLRLILDQLKGSLAVFIMITYDYSGEAT